MPTVAYCEHGPGCPEHSIRADYPFTAETEELREVYETQGIEAVGLRHKQQQQNRQRRHGRTDRKRYAAIALEKNLRLAAERLAERKLAEKDAQETLVGCPTATGCPTPAGVAGVGAFPADATVTATKRPPTSVSNDAGETIAPQEAATA